MISKLVFLIIGALGSFGFASPGIRSQIIQVFSQPSESDGFFLTQCTIRGFDMLLLQGKLNLLF